MSRFAYSHLTYFLPQAVEKGLVIIVLVASDQSLQWIKRKDLLEYHGSTELSYGTTPRQTYNYKPHLMLNGHVQKASNGN